MKKLIVYTIFCHILPHYKYEKLWDSDRQQFLLMSIDQSVRKSEYFWNGEIKKGGWKYQSKLRKALMKKLKMTNNWEDDKEIQIGRKEREGIKRGVNGKKGEGRGEGEI